MKTPNTPLKLATWNINRPVADDRRKALRTAIDSVAADIVVLTETHDGFDPGLPFSCSSEMGRDGNYPQPHRWVSIWSKYPLEHLETSDPIRTCAARIFPPLDQPFIVFGTVLPWPGSHWRQFAPQGGVAFKEALQTQVADWKRFGTTYSGSELFILGDFNQDLDTQRYCGTKATRAALLAALDECRLISHTSGDSDPIRRDSPEFACIDHICSYSQSRWTLQGTERWPNISKPELRLSDHFGVAASFVSSPKN